MRALREDRDPLGAAAAELYGSFTAKSCGEDFPPSSDFAQADSP